MSDLDDIEATIAAWQYRGITADEAWRSLGLTWAWAVEWYEVRRQMLAWAQRIEQPALRCAA